MDVANCDIQFTLEVLMVYQLIELTAHLCYNKQMKQNVEIKGARIHNLRNIDVTIPKNKLTVITGVSGSGKSSLAFDTLYEEGRKRYLMFSGTQLMVESEISVDDIRGLSPTVAVEQRIIRQSNPRSTVSTRTQIEALLSSLLQTLE